MTTGAMARIGIRGITAIWAARASSNPRSVRARTAGPTLLVGGYVHARSNGPQGTLRLDQGGSGPDQFVKDADKLDEAWKGAGRDDAPHKMALAYFSLGADAQANADEYLPTTTSGSARSKPR